MKTEDIKKYIGNKFKTEQLNNLKLKYYIIYDEKKPSQFSDIKIIAIAENKNNDFILIGCNNNYRYINTEIQLLAKDIIKKDTILYCLYEKSCGAVVYFKDKDKITYLIIKNRDGHYGAPKGHIESGEDELMTAQREIYEETGLAVQFHKDFRTSCRYTVKDYVEKESVYYIAKAFDNKITTMEGEIGGYLILPFEEMIKYITHFNDREIFEKADKFINSL